MYGHVLLGVLHLVAGRARQLEAHVVEEQHGHECDEQRVGRLELPSAREAEAVLERVDDRADHEQAEHEDPGPGSEGRDPLADPEGEDCRVDREPDVREADEVEQPRVVTDREEELIDGRDRQERERGPDPDRVAEPVEDGVDGRHEPPPRKPRPDVRATLLRERRAELCNGQRIRDEERDREEDEPREALGPLGRDDAERVDADDGADEEEVDVEAREVLLELGLLLEGHRRGVVDELVRTGDCAHG